MFLLKLVVPCLFFLQTQFQGLDLLFLQFQLIFLLRIPHEASDKTPAQQLGHLPSAKQSCHCQHAGKRFSTHTTFYTEHVLEAFGVWPGFGWKGDEMVIGVDRLKTHSHNQRHNEQEPIFPLPLILLTGTWASQLKQQFTFQNLLGSLFLALVVNYQRVKLLMELAIIWKYRMKHT